MTSAPMTTGFFSMIREVLSIRPAPTVTEDRTPEHEEAACERGSLVEMMSANPDGFCSDLDIQAMYEHFPRGF